MKGESLFLMAYILMEHLLEHNVFGVCPWHLEAKQCCVEMKCVLLTQEQKLSQLDKNEYCSYQHPVEAYEKNQFNFFWICHGWGNTRGKNVQPKCALLKEPKNDPLSVRSRTQKMTLWAYTQGPKKWPFELTLKGTIWLYILTSSNK